MTDKSDRQAGDLNELTEVVITPAMEDAGAMALLDAYTDQASWQSLARVTFQAMMTAAKEEVLAQSPKQPRRAP